MVYQSWHAGPNGTDSPTTTAPVYIQTDTSAGFHNFGVDMGPKLAGHYIDGVLTHQIPTPARFIGQTWYFMANLGLGGPTSWPSSAGTKKPFSGGLSGPMNIDWIRFYPTGTVLPVVSGADTAPILEPLGSR